MKNNDPNIREAKWWAREEDGRVRCMLCPRECRPRDGQPGYCMVRENLDGRFVTRAYGMLASIAVDPIEKKPLYHFLPGSGVLSVGSVGCTMGCVFCQNWSLSRGRPGDFRTRSVSSDELGAIAQNEGCQGVAFTYNEPTVLAEYVIDAARHARGIGLKTVLVTNGYVSDIAFDDLYADIDAANVDLKAMDPDFYRRRTLSELGPVLRVLERIKVRGTTWLEITNLLIPGWNDTPQQVDALCRWVLDHLGDDVPIHFSAFHPAHEVLDLSRTPEATVFRARQQALELGLRFVYAGNVATREAGETRCPSCGTVLIRRRWYRSEVNPSFVNGRCSCGTKLPGIFD